MSNEAKRVTNDRSWSDRFRLLSLLKAICMKFSGYIKPLVILDSSMVEHSAVNRVVVGSSPTRGVLDVMSNKRNYYLTTKLSTSASLRVKYASHVSVENTNAKCS